jgi:hypothetical protein
MLDWLSVKGTLYIYMKKQFAALLGGPEKDEVYGVGFFCDSSVGDVLAVANTEAYYEKSLQRFEEQFGPTDADQFRWDIGGWKYPAGLPWLGTLGGEFDAAWCPYRESLRQLEEEEIQGQLEDACREVLGRLVDDGVFANAANLRGFAILGPDDPGSAVLEKKEHLDYLLERL